MRRAVDLPQPEGPTSTRTSPSAMSRVRSFTAIVLPKTLVALSMRMPAMCLPFHRAGEDALDEVALQQEEDRQGQGHGHEGRGREELVIAAEGAHKVG